MGKMFDGFVPLDSLYEFLQRRGHTLLIKGDAGTGKTTLALEVLRVFGKGGMGVYLSTRVSPEKLYTQFKWIKEMVKTEHLVSTTYAPDETKFDDMRLRYEVHIGEDARRNEVPEDSFYSL